MKFKNPLDYVKEIINKFKELVSFPYKRKIYSTVLILTLLLSICASFIFLLLACMVVPNKDNNPAVAGIIKELNCYPAGFKHLAYCRVKFDNYFFRNEFTDDFNDGKNGLKRAYISDLLTAAYREKKCVFIEYDSGSILRLEYCNGEILYLYNYWNEVHLSRNYYILFGICFFAVVIFMFLLLNKEFKRENQNLNERITNEQKS